MISNKQQSRQTTLKKDISISGVGLHTGVDSTATFKPWNENIRVAISSPLYDGDFITTMHTRAVNEKWDWAMTIWEPTWNLNPNLTKEVLEEERRKDPISFDRDFGATPGVEIENFMSSELIKRVKQNQTKNHNFLEDLENLEAKNDAVYYIVGTDPAVKNDSFGLALGHVTTGGEVIIDGSLSFSADRGEEIKSEQIKEILIPLFEHLPVQYYIFDAYLHGELKDLAEDYGITTFQHYLNLEDWIKTRDMLDKGTAQLPLDEQLSKELQYLQLIKGKQVDHPRKFPDGSKGGKDVADACCQIISLVRRTEDLQSNKYSKVPSFIVQTF